MNNSNSSLKKTRVTVVEPDQRLRSDFISMLGPLCSHYEPCSGVSELAAHYPDNGIILVNDIDHVLADILKLSEDAPVLLPVVAYASVVDSNRVSDAIFLGAMDYFQFPFDIGNMTARIPLLLDRFDKVKIDRARVISSRRLMEQLTKREREVLDLIVMGRKSKKIAEDLGMALRTVEIHRKNMTRKFDVGSTFEVVKIAVNSGLYK
ncbi:LuxR C-terminal-related transcriptional regulator [Croceicoccus bisphenolivorans]|uniref:LuxR C-terminal-related transcriptional regulator n=1 Tax=Croceicoccus bisphenolivorans TaxID=1783232 RepID=UPI000B033701|nr:LuxR C-terminal-related transcriptional regulator [Croceicoccus bisphenolivorans]